MYFHIKKGISKLSSSRQLKFQLNWDSIITKCLPPHPTRPHPTLTGIVPRCSSRLAFATYKDSRGLLRLSEYLEYEDYLKYEDDLKYEDNLKYKDNLKYEDNIK